MILSVSLKIILYIKITKLGGDEVMQRSFEEIKIKCSTILTDNTVLNLVIKSSSPTAAYEMIIAITGDLAKAKAGRWLAILRRDYVEEYKNLVSNQVMLQ